jgi:hypothetical protein
MSRTGRFAYVGPSEVGLDPPGDLVVLRTSATLSEWLGRRPRSEHTEPITYVVDLNGHFRLGPRRSEHVACANGEQVLAAGEVSFAKDQRGWAVSEVSNQSTGYCPDLDSWEAVALALDRVRIPHPRGFTNPVVFRRCPRCDQPNIVRDGDFTCALCDAQLPPQWNFGT